MCRRDVVALSLALACAPRAAPTATAPREGAAAPRVAVPPPADVPAARTTAPDPSALRVCSDPNNLPFSNDRGEGFENRLAELIAADLGRSLVYVWKPHRRGFLRTGLNAGACDLVMGLPAGLDAARTTRPYYRSTYVFVGRRGARPVRSFDDPSLASMRIGVQLIGDDYANTPPAHALARRGLAQNLVGYTVYGDYAEETPAAEVVRAVARGDVDVAVAWGPLAGYLARQRGAALVVSPVSGDDAGAPMRFDIAMAVRRSDRALHARVDAFIAARHTDIARILADYGVPRG